MNDCEPRLASDFRKFAKEYILRNVPQVKVGEVPSFDEWVAKYPGGRRRMMRELRECTVHGRDDYLIMSFIKDECYCEFKPARSINHLKDIFAAYLGTACTAADKALYNVCINVGSGFVKGTNPATWGELQEVLFGDKAVSTTDFTSFEAHHRGVFSEIVAFWLNHALRPLGLPSSLRQMLREAIMGDNRIKMRGLRILVYQRLMSGNLWTSSANGLLNLLINSFLYSYKPNRSIEKMLSVSYAFKILVEGDDAIFQYHRRNRDLIARMGLRYKLEDFADYGVASFCSTFRSMRTSRVFCEPTKVLQKFFTLPMSCESKKMDLHMMRAKALSYGTLYPHSPIVAELCRYVLHETRGFDCRKQLETLRGSEYKFRNLNTVLKHSEIGGNNISETDIEDFSQLFDVPLQTIRTAHEDIMCGRLRIESWKLADEVHLATMFDYVSTTKTSRRDYSDMNVLLGLPATFNQDDQCRWTNRRPCFAYRTSAFRYDD